jgi:hypothetical protein
LVVLVVVLPRLVVVRLVLLPRLDVVIVALPRVGVVVVVLVVVLPWKISLPVAVLPGEVTLPLFVLSGVLSLSDPIMTLDWLEHIKKKKLNSEMQTKADNFALIITSILYLYFSISCFVLLSNLILSIFKRRDYTETRLACYTTLIVKDEGIYTNRLHKCHGRSRTTSYY